MQDVSDQELLRRYAKDSSNEAFAELAARYVNLVYSAALRKTGDAHAAEEITQAVFIILARKAQGLHHATILSGWLYQTARLTAANFLRTEIRRIRREQEAYMQSSTHETEAETWPHIAPLLENAMGDLGEKDRNAIVLRFFEGKSFQEIGLAFGASENAAKKRVHYALEKLRKFFAKRGVVSTTAALAAVISTNSIQAAPAGVMVSTVAAAKGSVTAGSTLNLVNGTLKFMASIKIKSSILIGVAVLLTAAATTTVYVQATNAGHSSPGDPLLIIPGESVGKIRKGMTVPQVEAELGKPSQFLFGKKMVYENSTFGSVIVNEKTGVSVVTCDGPFLQKTGVKFSTGRHQTSITSETTKAQLIAELGMPMSYSQVNGDRQNFAYKGLEIVFKKDKVLSINILFPK